MVSVGSLSERVRWWQALTRAKKDVCFVRESAVSSLQEAGRSESLALGAERNVPSLPATLL